MSLVTAKHVPTRADVIALFRLAVPLVLIQVGTMLMGVVDTLMVGRVSPEALAAVALGNVFFLSFSLFGMGVLFALDPIVAQALGANDELAVHRGLQRGLLLSLLLAIPAMLALLAVRPVLELVGQPAPIVPAAAAYVHRVIPSVPAFLVFVVLRQTLQAHRRLLPLVVTIVVSNLLNAALNYLWIFGKGGFPALGVLGSAWATTASRWFMVVLLVALGWRELGLYLRRLAPNVFALRPLGRMLRLGAPIGGQLTLEGGVFSTVALLMGWLGVVQVAAHQIAINLASLTFMVPLGVSSAATVIVGHAVGRNDPGGVHRSTLTALGVGAGFMAVMAVLLIGVPRSLAGLYTRDLAVLAVGGRAPADRRRLPGVRRVAGRGHRPAPRARGYARPDHREPRRILVHRLAGQSLARLRSPLRCRGPLVGLRRGSRDRRGVPHRARAPARAAGSRSSPHRRPRAIGAIALARVH